MVAFPDMGRTNGHKGAPRHGAAGRKPPRTPRSHARDFLYRKIAADLRAKLRSGAIAPGARLPSLKKGFVLSRSSRN